MAVIISGDELDDAARTVAWEARRLQHARDELRRHTDATQWTGHARDTFGHLLGPELHSLITVSDHLDATARRLRTLADDARHERNELDRLENEVMDAQRRDPQPQTFLSRAGVAALPARWDTDWRTVHAQINRFTAHHAAAHHAER